MKDILVICRNCGEIQRYDEEIFIKHNMKKYSSCRCGNKKIIYQRNRKWANNMIKNYNHQEVIDLINEDKYNEKIFGKHKGFDYKKVESEM